MYIDAYGQNYLIENYLIHYIFIAILLNNTLY